MQFRFPEISFVIISKKASFVKIFFQKFLEILSLR